MSTVWVEATEETPEAAGAGALIAGGLLLAAIAGFKGCCANEATQSEAIAAALASTLLKLGCPTVEAMREGYGLGDCTIHRFRESPRPVLAALDRALCRLLGAKSG